MTTKMPRLSQAGSILQFGKDGKKVKSESTHLKLVDADGSTLTRLKVAQAVDGDDVPSLAQVQADIANSNVGNFANAKMAISAMPAYAYSNGASGVGATITENTNAVWVNANSDGLAPQVGDVVYFLSVADSGLSDNAHAGVYEVTQLGDGSTQPTIFTRRTPSDQSSEWLAYRVGNIDNGGVSFGGKQVQYQGSSEPTMGSDSLALVEIGDFSIADNTVGTAELKDGAVTNEKLSADAVDGAKIADDAIGSEHLASDSVVSDAIATGAVTGDKIGADAVDGSKIADNSIGSEHISDDAVTLAKINFLVDEDGMDSDSDVLVPTQQSVKAYADAIYNATFSYLGSTLVDEGASYVAIHDANGRYLANSVEDALDEVKAIADTALQSIPAGSIGATELAADAVDGSKIADNAIATEHYTDDSISIAKLDATTRDKINNAPYGIYKVLNASDFSSGEFTLGDVPLGAVIGNIDVNVVTAFDNGADITIGYTGDTAKYLDTEEDLSQVGLLDNSTRQPIAAAQTLKAYLSHGGTQPTVGQAYIYIEYKAV